MQCLAPTLKFQNRFISMRSFFEADSKSYIDHVRRGNYDILPCSTCLNCRILKSREWANRLACEMQDWSYTYFLTLTYDEENLPLDFMDHYLTAEINVGVPVVNNTDVNKFIKRLKYKFGDLNYFYSAEYGTKTHRPHYHLILFTNVKFDIFDIAFNRYISNDGQNEEISKIWGLGQVRIAEAIPARLKYVAQYTSKKYLTKKENYGARKKEFISMSKKVPLGFNYFLRNKDKFWAIDSIQPPVDVGAIRIPRSYLVYASKNYLISDLEIDKLKEKRRRSLWSFYKKNPDFIKNSWAENFYKELSLNKKDFKL